MVKIGAELPSYPQNKTGYPFLDHPVKEEECRGRCLKRFVLGVYDDRTVQWHLIGPQVKFKLAVRGYNNKTASEKVHTHLLMIC